MKSLRKILLRSAIVAGALALSAPAFAHGAGHKHAARAAPAGMGMQSQRMSAGDLNQHDARALWLLHFANQAETTTAQLADSHSQNDQVKSYAKMLLDDHSSLDNKLMDFARDHKVQFPEMMQGMGAGMQGTGGAGMQGTPATQGTSGMEQGSAQQGAGSAGMQGNPAGTEATAQGNQGMAQNPQAAPPNLGQAYPLSRAEMGMMSHAKSSAKKLDSLRGRNFDRQFLSDNVKDHRQVISELNRMVAQVQNQDLKNMIKDTLPKLQDHEKKAQDLLHSLGGQARTPATRR